MTAVVPTLPTSTTRKILGTESRSTRYEDDERTNVTRLIRGREWRINAEKRLGPQMATKVEGGVPDVGVPK